MAWAFIIAALLAAEPPRFPKGLAPMTLPQPARGLQSWSDAECESCHEAQAAEHALSGHAVARSSYVFQAGVKDEQPQWCVGCHAPLSQSRAERRPPDGSAEEAGIGCAACHAGTRGVLSTGPSASSPHAIEPSASLRDGSLCAGCHQFGFLLRNAAGQMAGLAAHRPQQDTVAEWLTWKQRTGDARACWSCHARNGSGHALSGHRSLMALHEALVVERGDGVLRIRSRDVGHALPTGDVMRWLSLELSSDGFFTAAPAARFGLRLGTRTWPGEREPRLGIVEDTRLQPGAVREVPIPPGAVAWQLVYHRVSEGQEQRGNLSPALSRIVVLSGTLSKLEAVP